MSVHKNQPESTEQSRIPNEAQFICCKCNELIGEAQTRRKTKLQIVCERGHPAIRLLPPYLSFVRGLSLAILAVFGAAIVSIRLPNSYLALIGGAMAACSGFACTRILQGNSYAQLAAPASKLARQAHIEAMGTFAGLLIANLFVFQ